MRDRVVRIDALRIEIAGRNAEPRAIEALVRDAAGEGARIALATSANGLALERLLRAAIAAAVARRTESSSWRR